MKNLNYQNQLKIGLLTLLVSLPVYSFTITPAQPGANTTYRFTDVYTLAGGVQKSVSLNPAGVEELIRGGTGTFLATLQAEFPTWTFSTADSDLTGSFNVQSYYACGPGTLDCGTERAVPATTLGSFIDITYTAGAGDPTLAGNDLHWIQRVISNHASGSAHGTTGDIVDNDSGDNEPVLGDCDDVPYYDCGYFAGETFFVDRPGRNGDNENNHTWAAELYLVEQTAADTVTIYNGVRWGWQNTDSDVRALTAPPSSIRFENHSPAGGVTTGMGSNDITWGTAVTNSFPSSLSISPNTFDLTPLIGEPFVLGTITYANGTIRRDTGIDSADLIVETSIDVPDLGITGLSIEDTRLVSMINTRNTCNAQVAGDCSTAEARESADYVSIPPASDIVDIPAVFPNFSELGNNFHVLEESQATATLIGRITEVRINDANSGNGLLPPGPDAPAPGIMAPQQTLVWEILGFGSLLEGDGFITIGEPGTSIPDGDEPIDVDIDIPGGGIVTIGFDSANPTVDHRATIALEKLVRILIKYPRMTIDIGGHTDNTGSPRLNQVLSEKRALEVSTFLTKRGISKERIRVTGYADKKPLASNKTESGRAKNRRVELLVEDRSAKHK